MFVRSKSPIAASYISPPDLALSEWRAIRSSENFYFSQQTQAHLNSRVRASLFKMTTTKHKARLIKVSLSVFHFWTGARTPCGELNFTAAKPSGSASVTEYPPGFQRRFQDNVTKLLIHGFSRASL